MECFYSSEYSLFEEQVTGFVYLSFAFLRGVIGATV